MPEGDTIRRIASRLAPALEGERLERFDAPRLTGPRPRPGSLITAVRARGKHLCVDFDDDVTIRVHLGMSGSWYLYRVDERWSRARAAVRLRLGVEGWDAVCFSAPTVTSSRHAETGTAHLGPDLSDEHPDLDAAIAALARFATGDTEIGVALLDQRIASGVGNVFKSEVCAECGISPFTPVAELDEATRRQLLDTAHRQLRANAGGGPRQTVPGGLAVYGRVRQGCGRCGGEVRQRRRGEHARVTYWCVSCQPG